MPNKIKNFLNKLIYVGVGPQQSFSLENRIVLTNKITLVVVTSAICYLLGFVLFLRSFYLSSLLMVFTLIFASPLFFNHFKQYNAARLLLIIGGNLSTMLHALIVGEAAGFHLVLFPAAAAALFLFELHQKRYILFGIALSISCLAVLEMINYKFFYQIVLPNNIIFLLNLSFKALTILLLLLWLYFLYIYFAQTQKKIKQAYDEAFKSMNYAEKVSNQAAYANLTQRIAHELRNPLTIIQVGVDLAFKENTSREKIDEISLMVKDNIHRMLKVTDVMLKYGQEKNDIKSTFNIEEIIKDAIDIARNRFEDKKIALNTNFAPTKDLYAFKQQLYQVIIHLINNCIEAIDKHGTITITTSELQAEQDEPIQAGISLIVSDDGCGIQEQDLPKIFDPFFTKKDRNIGLGLSMVYRIINNHNGDIQVSSKVKEGTSFGIKLPYEDKFIDEKLD